MLRKNTSNDLIIHIFQSSSLLDIAPHYHILIKIVYETQEIPRIMVLKSKDGHCLRGMPA